MKFIRYSHQSETRHGLLEGELVSELQGNIFGDWQRSGKTLPLTELKLLAPVMPTTIFCIGKNYRAHAAEFGTAAPAQPIVFLKAPNSLNPPYAPIVLPKPEQSMQIDYEAELAIVIGKGGKNIPETEALKHVFGYTCANDVTARDWQKQDGQWARAKSLDGFCPLGPYIETELDTADLKIEGRLNGVRVQSARTSELLFNVPFLVHYVSQAITLSPGSIILSGTPAGCGMARKPPLWLQPGDSFEVDIEGIGILVNPVQAAE